ncbi:MAG: agmatinase [Candidatus Schekmanbacteria bacterium]|nr:agmatinase [Candidatus Schekmanbacteria bacterium]
MKLLEKYHWLPNNFLALPEENSNWEDSKVVILPLPYEQTTSYQGGTRMGPAAIIRASQNVELYDCEIQREPYHNIGIYTLPELIADYSSYENNLAQIQNVTVMLLESNKFPVALGGEHSISLGLVKAFAAKYPNLSVLQLDAHADLRESYQETPYNHACVMRQIIEHAPAVQVGIRNLSREEADFARVRELDIFYAHQIQHGYDWIEQAVERLDENVYLTIDLDVFDPSIMPAVGTPEPGGLTWYPVLELLRTVAEQRKIVGADVVELCPIPFHPAPDFLAAKLIYKLLGYVFP